MPDELTYEEHVARAMLLGGLFLPSYHCYNIPHKSVFDGRWLDANTLENIGPKDRSSQPSVLDDRYKEWRQCHQNSSVDPTDKRYFQWKKWS